MQSFFFKFQKSFVKSYLWKSHRIFKRGCKKATPQKIVAGCIRYLQRGEFISGKPTENPQNISQAPNNVCTSSRLRSVGSRSSLFIDTSIKSLKNFLFILLKKFCVLPPELLFFNYKNIRKVKGFVRAFCVIFEL